MGEAFLVTSWKWGEGKEGAGKELQIPGWHNTANGPPGSQEGMTTVRGPGLRCSGGGEGPDPGRSNQPGKKGAESRDFYEKKQNPF